MKNNKINLKNEIVETIGGVIGQNLRCSLIRAKILYICKCKRQLEKKKD